MFMARFKRLVTGSQGKGDKVAYDYNQKKIGKFDPSKGSESSQWNAIHPKTQEEIDQEEFESAQRKARLDSIKKAWKEQQWPG